MAGGGNRAEDAYSSIPCDARVENLFVGVQCGSDRSITGASVENDHAMHVRFLIPIEGGREGKGGHEGAVGHSGMASHRVLFLPQRLTRGHAIPH